MVERTSFFTVSTGRNVFWISPSSYKTTNWLIIWMIGIWQLSTVWVRCTNANNKVPRSWNCYSLSFPKFHWACWYFGRIEVNVEEGPFFNYSIKRYELDNSKSPTIEKIVFSLFEEFLLFFAFSWLFVLLLLIPNNQLWLYNIV